jgi:hypothetical protein
MVVCYRNEIQNVNTSCGKTKIKGFFYMKKKCVIDGGIVEPYMVIELMLGYYCLCFSW